MIEGNTATDEIAAVLAEVNEWPATKRLTLAQRLLEGLKADVVPTAPRKRPLRDLLGLLKVPGPAPTDEECERILEEELQRKLSP